MHISNYIKYQGFITNLRVLWNSKITDRFLCNLLHGGLSVVIRADGRHIPMVRGSKQVVCSTKHYSGYVPKLTDLSPNPRVSRTKPKALLQNSGFWAKSRVLYQMICEQYLWVLFTMHGDFKQERYGYQRQFIKSSGVLWRWKPRFGELETRITIPM